MTHSTSPFRYRVAIAGCPSHPDVEWNEANLTRLRDLGFNTVQLNVAWGGRPGDEPLNLEDLVALPPARLAELNQPDLPPRSVPERRDERRAQLTHRIALCRELGLRTIFHFGAPFNAQYGIDTDFDGPQARSLLDPETTLYYREMIRAFDAEFPGVDDLLVYTYDQDAWVTSEFGTCVKTRGHTLADQVVPFVSALAEEWRAHRAEGWLWWSPWELSAGQVYECVDRFATDGIGLDLHPNVAETMLTLPVDRWLKNTVRLASQRGIPVLVESFLGAMSEELEPYQYLMHPNAVIRQVRTIASVPGVSGIKEYYGLNPTKWDANLSAAARAMMADEEITEATIVRDLATPFGDAADAVIEAWRLFSEAQEFLPWDLSWYLREFGTSDVSHALTAAGLRGAQVPTPSWESTRRAIFMKNDDAPPHPWMLEDVQLRFGFAEKRIEQALEALEPVIDRISPSHQVIFKASIREARHLLRRVRTYRLHARETNIATMLRTNPAGAEALGFLIDELIVLLREDHENQVAAYSDQGTAALEGAHWIWEDATTYKSNLPWAVRTFTRSFPIASVQSTGEVWLTATSSDRLVRASVNGHLVEGFGTGPPPFRADIVSLLREGHNEIEIRTFKSGSLYERPGICAAIDGPDRIQTDENWRVAKHSTEAKAAVLIALYGDQPWGNQGAGDGGRAIRGAIDLLNENPAKFLETYFQRAPNERTHGLFSVTSC